MSGFRATADPRLTNDFKVTAVIVEDPLYPHGSRPGVRVRDPARSSVVKQLGRQFVPRRRRSTWNNQRWSVNLAGKYVMVVPFVVQRSVPDEPGFAPIHL